VPARVAGAAVTLTLAAGCAAHQPPRATSPLEQLRADLTTIFNASLMAHGQWAVDIRSLESGERILSVNAGKLMMPASNMKILTLATAAETLGWDATMTTTLEAAGPIAGGVLHGDLFVRGGGDPTINSRDGAGDALFSEWATALKTAGITSIEGRIVGDDQAFDDEGIGGGWAWDYLQYGYAAPVGALQYNENVAELVVTPGAAGEPAGIWLAAGSGLLVLNRAVTGAEGSESSIDFRRHLDKPILEITGTIPAGGKPAVRSVAVVNPTVFFAQSLKDGLSARGISVSGDAVDFDDVAASIDVRLERQPLATRTSPPVRAIAATMMKVSQNLYAETLLKAAGRARGGLGTTAAGREAADATFKAWGLTGPAYVMTDGSGLSRYNYVSAAALTAILEHMYKDPKHRDAMLATMPIAGKDGTLATRMRGTRAEGNAVAKTGSISNVRTLSGFVRTRDGQHLVFSMLANDFVIPGATVTWITDLAVEVLANYTNGGSRRPAK
jgi:D-alanyl-D-alanine carboxypeptidase/D-alanyl-D-alanine-endopeptidase (penicillin-binding protein 4)